MSNILDGKFEVRNDPIKKCSQAAFSLGYQVFALSEGECKTSVFAKLTYQMYGTSNACNDHGTGGKTVNRVYELDSTEQPTLLGIINIISSIYNHVYPGGWAPPPQTLPLKSENFS